MPKRCATITQFLIAISGSAVAAEGGLSHYLPGTAGDIAIAQSPDPGLQVGNTLWYQTGDIGAAVLQGAVNLDLDLDNVLNLLSASYTFERSILGGTFTVAGILPFGYAELSATIVAPDGMERNASSDSFALTDPAFIPAQLNWNRGNFSYKLAHVITAPFGDYDEDDIVNLGRNYWSFDTVGAITWFDPTIGTELSVAPGIMYNTENDDTNYQTGAEFHVDYTANQFLSETFAIGLRGYWYKQITDDSGDGALLGDFRSEAYGLGPGFLWTPKFAGGRLSILGKWMHDIDADNRFESDYYTLTGAWKF